MQLCHPRVYEILEYMGFVLAAFPLKYGFIIVQDEIHEDDYESSKRIWGTCFLHCPEIWGCPYLGGIISTTNYQGHMACPLYRGSPYLGESVIGCSNVQCSLCRVARLSLVGGNGSLVHTVCACTSMDSSLKYHVYYSWHYCLFHYSTAICHAYTGVCHHENTWRWLLLSRQGSRASWDLATSDSVGLRKSSTLFEVLDKYFLA